MIKILEISIEDITYIKMCRFSKTTLWDRVEISYTKKDACYTRHILGKRTGCNRGEAKKSITYAWNFCRFRKHHGETFELVDEEKSSSPRCTQENNKCSCAIGIDRRARKLDGKNFYRRERAFGGLKGGSASCSCDVTCIQSSRKWLFLKRVAHPESPRRHDVRLRIGILRDGDDTRSIPRIPSSQRQDAPGVDEKCKNVAARMR